MIGTRNDFLELCLPCAQEVALSSRVKGGTTGRRDCERCARRRAMWTVELLTPEELEALAEDDRLSGDAA